MIRLAAASDAPQLAALHGSAFPRGWSEEEFRNFLSHTGTQAWVAANADTVTGFLLTRSAADETEIITLVVNAEKRRTGIAVALLNHAIAALAAAGTTRVLLEVSEENFPAYTLYLRSEFSEYGRRKDYYRNADGSRSDAILMHRHL